MLFPTRKIYWKNPSPARKAMDEKYHADWANSRMKIQPPVL